MQELHRQWGRNIEARMKLLGYGSHAALAEALDVRQSTVTRWIRGERGVRDHHKVALARLLRCEVPVLFPMFVGASA